VIAGLKWPPEMWPTAETMTAITSPFASATPTTPGSPLGAAAITAPAPTKMSANAPTNSAVPRRKASVSTAEKVVGASDSNPPRAAVDDFRK
jgi:hypothetical protein